MTSGDAALEESSAKDADKFLGSAEKTKSQFCRFDKSHVNKYKDEKRGQNSFGNVRFFTCQLCFLFHGQYP